ncbi:histidine kinase dimerization/phosphoacceptor domain -containing protein [Fodinibius sp. N2]|uniref:histidine kinase dimerization/phosphoacceptor domain -containing protein n=1 Tax=Fodinibius alkaliphilus TaxID=3140241 RepID=UPI00315A2697
MSIKSEKNNAFWQPLTFDVLLSRYSILNKRVWSVLAVWILCIFFALYSTIYLLPNEWMSLSNSRADVMNFFLFNPALILGLLLFFWFGFEWGFIPIFLCSFVIAFHSSMPWGWALVFAGAFVLGIAICAMAYQGFSIPYDLKSFKSIAFFISIMFIASIASSLGSFIWSFTHQLSASETLMIWKSWWSGSFIQAVVFTGPILWIFTPAIEKFKRKWFQLPERGKLSLKWVSGAVTSITAALALFIFSGKYLGKLRVQEVMAESQTATVVDVINALESFEIISWISIGIILVTGYGAFKLIGGWNQQLSTEVKNRTQQLQESQEKLQVSLDEKKMLLEEIHHRVKNNMALVSALLELQEQTSETGNNKALFKTARARIKSMALAHEVLYQNKSFSSISMKDYLKRISELTHRSFSYKNKDIDLTFDLEDVSIEMSKSIPLGLVINEILINAHKHAFNGQDNARIELESTVDNEMITISVRDNGVGLPKDINEMGKKSLGMTLIKKFAKQLKADLSIESEKGQGTMFRLAFPNS